MVATFARTADSRTTSNGQVKPPPKMLSPSSGLPAGAQKPLARQSIGSSGMSSTAASLTVIVDRGTLSKLSTATDNFRRTVSDQVDLLLAGGDVIDPGGGHRGRLDVAVRAGRIAAVGPALPRAAAEVVDCTSK